MVLSAVLIGTAAVPCFAGTVEDLENKISDSQNTLQQLQTQLDSLSGQYTSLQTQTADKQYELTQLESDLNQAKQEEAEQHDGMKARIKYIYEALGGDTEAFELCSSILGGAAVTSDSENIAELTRYDREMLGQYQDTCDEIRDKTEEVADQKQKLQELEQECQGKQQEITDLITATDSNIASYQNQLTDARQAELLEQIRQQEATLQAVFQNSTAETADAVVSQVGVSGGSVQNAASAGNSIAVTSESTTNGQSASAAQTTQTQNQTSAQAAAQTGSGSTSYSSGWSGTVLNRSNGVVYGPTGKETYYNLDMSGVVDYMRQQGNTGTYWVRDDGVKMLGDYVIVAANTDKYPKGTIVDSSLGKAIVCDTGDFASSNSDQLDIAVAW